jgi:hypothetical protein
MESQLGELTQMLKELQAQNSSIQRTLNDNLAAIHDVGVWRPKIDAKVDNLHQSVTDLQQKVDQLASRQTINLTTSTAPHQSEVSSGEHHLPIGAGVETSNRGIGNGVVTTFVPTPVKGAHTTPHPSVPTTESQLHFDMTKAIPQFEFPKFDGKKPQVMAKEL